MGSDPFGSESESVLFPCGRFKTFGLVWFGGLFCLVLGALDPSTSNLVWFGGLVAFLMTRV
jgi:hypothetical protein